MFHLQKTKYHQQSDNREEKGTKEYEQNSTNLNENVMRDSIQVVSITVSFIYFIPLVLRCIQILTSYLQLYKAFTTKATCCILF